MEENDMKFICESVPQGLRIPTAALNLSHIPYGGKVELHTLDCALVLLKEIGRHTSERQSHSDSSYAVFCLKKIFF